MKGHRLVGEGVEGQAPQLVARADLKLGAGVVLQLAANLAGDVHADERQDVWPESS